MPHVRSVIRRHRQLLWWFISAETVDVELRAAAGTPKYVHRQRIAFNQAHKDIALAVRTACRRHFVIAGGHGHTSDNMAGTSVPALRSYDSGACTIHRVSQTTQMK
jgi:hypothetical protein